MSKASAPRVLLTSDSSRMHHPIVPKPSKPGEAAAPVACFDPNVVTEPLPAKVDLGRTPELMRCGVMGSKVLELHPRAPLRAPAGF
jgi:hypothetical protein